MNTIKQYLEHLINFLDYIQGYTILQKKVLIKIKVFKEKLKNNTQFSGSLNKYKKLFTYKLYLDVF